MARIDEVRERYESITEQLYKNKETFAEYLKFAGKFYKMPTAQTMTMFATNPKATMVADYDTWKKYGHYVKRGANSIAVLCGNGLKHYFDISQTNGDRVPYQWTLDKQTAQEFIAAFSKAEGREFKSMSSCVNAIGRAAAAETIENAVKALNISEADRAAFEKSFISITQYFIAARCELGGKFDYKNSPMDLTAFDLVHSKAEAEKLTEYVQITARPALLSMEKSINSIIAERSMNYGRNQTDMVRGGQDVLSRNQGGERQDVQARPDNVRVSGTGGTGADGRGTEADERADRPLGQGVAEVYDGELSRRNPVAGGTAQMGADTEADRQRGLGDVGTPAEAVRTEQSSPENLVRRNREMGENTQLHSGTRGNGADSSSAQRINSTTAEDNSPAVSLSPEQQYIADKIAAFLGSPAPYDVCNSVYRKAFEYSYENRIPIEQIPADELDDIISEITGVKKEIEIPADLDKFYVNTEMENVTWIYYNPDSTAGGQFVYTYMSFDDIFNAMENDDPLQYLTETCEQYLLDRGTDGFDGVTEEFMTDSEDISSREEGYVDKLFALTEPRYAIYQLKDGEDLRNYRFTDSEYLKKHGMYIDRENYNRVYRGRLKEDETLEDIYERFNINRPNDFRGHSLSIGDIVAVKKDGAITAHYVDRIGFTEIPDFTLSREERKARRTLTDNLTLIAENQLSSDEMDDL
ncbi:MAG: YodL domain-containing protein, partial [Ruminiclostridium sp.]